MSVLGVDYSFSRPSPALLESKGFKFVCRYLGGSSDKRITRSEAAALHAHGIAIVLVYESAANRSAQGYWAGVADAREALREAALVGVPAGTPVLFAVDFDAEWRQVEPYFKGVQKVLGILGGPYGSDKITRGARTIGIRYTWQTCAWSGGRLDPHANIYQRQAMTRFVPGCDEDVLLNAMPMWGNASNLPQKAPHPAAVGPDLAPIIRELNAAARKTKSHTVWLRLHNAVLALTGKK